MLADDMFDAIEAFPSLRYIGLSNSEGDAAVRRATNW